MPQTKKLSLYTALLYPENLHRKWQTALGTIPWKDAISPIHNLDLKDIAKLEKEIEKANKGKEKKPVNPFNMTAKEKEREEQLKQDQRVVEFLKPMSQDELELLTSEYDALRKRKDKTTSQQEQFDRLKICFKKEHYHLIIDTVTPVTGRAVRNRLNRRLRTKAPQVMELKDPFEMWQYLSHESYKALKAHKHIYDRSKIVTLNGFDIADYETLDTAEFNRMASKVFDLAEEMKLESYLAIRNKATVKLGITKQDFDKIMRTRMPQLNAVMYSVKNYSYGVPSLQVLERKES